MPGAHTVSGFSADTVFDGRCVSSDRPWSILDLAVANAQLAGVFAGFMVLAITTLLIRDWPTKSGRSVSHTLALFATGVLVLGLDAYFFGTVAATRPFEADQPITLSIGEVVINFTQASAGAYGADNASVCLKAWIKFMPAAGMLAVGASLLLAGIGWMLTHHAAEDQDPDKKMIYLGNTLTGMAIAGTTALLIYDSLLFVDAAHTVLNVGGPLVKVIVACSGAMLILASVIIVLWKSWGIPRPITGQWEEILDSRYKLVERLSLAIVGYLALCLAISWGLPTWQEWPWPTIPIKPAYKLWEPLALGLFLPAVLNIFIALSIPGPYSRRGFKRRLQLFSKSFGEGEIREIEYVRDFERFTEIFSKRTYVSLSSSIELGNRRMRVLPLLKEGERADWRRVIDKSYSLGYCVYVHNR